MLTKKQRELLLFIHRRLGEDGVSPSFDEMKDALDLKSKSGIHRLITALEERGFIRRLPHRARALEVMKLPDAASEPKAVPSSNVVTPVFGNPSSAPFQSDNSTVELPLYGRIAAGTPIEALQNNLAMVGIPAAMVSRGEHYALEIAGDSMVEAGIMDGDTVVIRRGDVANNGDIVVALVDDAEATLKRFRRRGREIALEPANASYETRVYNAERVKVQGRLVGLIRQY